MWKCRELWLIFILGLFLAWNRCEGRAVNISNTWTLPHEGFNVFYRFFRDKISWFEADAVCQFHHANLATVDNSKQFDAARDFLKELDVTETVWIGLMRPQNSQRFAWSNSKPLTSTSEYWGESLPLIESPLCAVIDPVRDFRWHALRCGGPETASFLCEMNIPDWASECAINGSPSVTVQYMADSGTVELSKDCGDEGTLHQVCKGKKDQERIIKELICKNDQPKIVEENSITPTDVVETNPKSLQIISSIPTDYTDDNKIGTNSIVTIPKKETEQNTVQKLIEQFNVEELMQADQPERLDGEIPKPVKKTGKKAKMSEKKDKSVKKQKNQKGKPKPASEEELMMGDQPALDVNDIQEPLPHIKKSFPQDLKHHDTTPFVAPTTTEQTSSGTTDLRHRRDMDSTSTMQPTETTSENIPSTLITTTPAAPAAPAVPAGDAGKFANIGHPMQPKQTRVTPAAGGEDILHTAHVKETSDDHFIPPMLLVKSHYTSTKSHLEEQVTANSSEKIETTTDKVESQTLSTGVEMTTDFPITATPSPLEIHNSSHSDEQSRTAATAKKLELLKGDNSMEEITTTSAPSHPTAATPESSSSAGPAFSSATPESTPIVPVMTTVASIQDSATTHHQVVEIKIGSSDNPTTFSITTRAVIPPSTPPASASPSAFASVSSPPSVVASTGSVQTTSGHEHESHKEIKATLNQNVAKNNDIPSSVHGIHHFDSSSSHSSESKEEHYSKTKNKFSNEENYQPYKPNRRRSLTKPEATTYLKKILG